MEPDVREWHPRHVLSKLSVDVVVHEDGDRVVTIKGYADTHRTALWTDSWTAPEEDSALHVAEVIDWVVAQVLIDGPASQASYERAIGATGQSSIFDLID